MPALQSHAASPTPFTSLLPTNQVNKLEITGDKTLIAAAGNPHVRLFEVRAPGPAGPAPSLAPQRRIPASLSISAGSSSLLVAAGPLRGLAACGLLTPCPLSPPRPSAPARPPAATARSTATTRSPSCRTTATQATSRPWASRRTASGCTRAAKMARVSSCKRGGAVGSPPPGPVAAAGWVCVWRRGGAARRAASQLAGVWRAGPCAAAGRPEPSPTKADAQPPPFPPSI